MVCLRCTGERALFVAEEFALQQGVRNRRAIDRHETLGAPRRKFVQRAGEEFLAGATVAQEQNRCVGRCHFLDQAANAQHLGIAGDQVGERTWMTHRLQAPILLLQVEEPKRAVDREREQLGLEWLGEEIVRAHSHGTHGVRAIVLPGQHDDLGVGCGGEDLLQQREPLGDRIGIGRQAEVHRDNRWSVPANLRHRGLGIRRRQRLVLVQRPADLLLKRQIVLDDKKRSRLLIHAAAVCCACVVPPDCAPNSGNSSRTRVPTSGVLST